MAVLFMILSVNLDSVAVGFAYGIKQIKIPLISAVVISAFSIFYSAAALIAGSALADILPEQTCTYIGALILFAIGAFIIIGAFRNPDSPQALPKPKHGTLINWGIKSLGITISVVRDPYTCDFDSSRRIDVRESFYLSLALSADAVGVGLGSALAGVCHPIIPLLVGVSQILLLYSGFFAASYLSRKLIIDKRLCEIISGCILIFLSVLHILI